MVQLSVPQADILGLTVPDDDLKYDEELGHYTHGAIDWDEFWAVVKGDGPCNRERVAARVKAHNDGEWVRDAAMAHAKKKEQRQNIRKEGQVA